MARGDRRTQLRRAARAGRVGEGALARRGRGAASARGADLERSAGDRGRSSRPRSRTHRHVLAQGLHPAHHALPRPLPLLHVREAAGEAGPPVPHARGGRGDRGGGRGRWGARRRSSRSATGRRSATTSRGEWLAERGYGSTLDYVRAVAIRVIEETGLLPHLNPGVMSLRGDGAAEARERLDGHDARDVLRPARGARRSRTSARPTRCRRCGCARSRTPDASPIPFTTGILVGHRRDAPRARRVAVRDPRRSTGATATSRRSSCRTSARSRARPCVTRPSRRTRSSWPRSRPRASCSARA